MAIGTHRGHETYFLYAFFAPLRFRGERIMYEKPGPMFITERSIRPKCINQASNSLLGSGMALANRNAVKARFHYKDFTVILGILVALLIVVALWIGQQPEEQSVESTLTHPEISFPDPEAIKKAMKEVVKERN